MAEMGVVAVGSNCIVGPQRMLDLVRMITEECELPILAMPTPGLPQLVKGQVAYDTSPDYFAKATLRLAEEGARVLGGCCGTTPDHIAAIAKSVDGMPPRPGNTQTLASSLQPPTPRFTQYAGLETLTIRPDANFQMMNLGQYLKAKEMLARKMVPVIAMYSQAVPGISYQSP